MEAFVTSPGYEAALGAELRASRGEGAPDQGRTPQWPGLFTVAATGAGAAVDPVFARQRLPAAVLVKGESVRALAEAAFAATQPALDAAERPLVLHAFVPEPDRYRAVAGRASLVGEALVDLWRARRRRAFRRLVEPARAAELGASRAWSEVLLVQAALVGRSSLVVSAASPRPLPHGGFDLAPWPAGIAPVEEDRSAPSRAYGKLEEAFAWLGETPGPGQRCADLGGAPGGWAWRALARGARVLSVDRSPLVPPAAGHPALETVIGDAFRYQPPAPVDWLLCDVICEPPRTIALVERWLAAGWCRRLVATVKFKGAGGYGVLAGVADRLAALGASFVRLKHLHRHHNEVAVLASRARGEWPSGSRQDAKGQGSRTGPLATARGARPLSSSADVRRGRPDPGPLALGVLAASNRSTS